MVALVGVLIGICTACLWPTDAEKLDVPGISIDPQAMLNSTGLAAAGDNFTWQNHPNQNNGTQAEMRTGVASTGRALVRWTQAAIDSVVGAGTLVSARLDITLSSSSGWSGSGGLLSIHRVTQDWTELGSTANCAIDTNTGNDEADCSGATAWVLNSPTVAPWKAAPTDTLGVTNGQTGTISFTVTADVQAFLADTSNFGWVIKPKNDGATGDVRLRSREATSNQPVLVITVDADTGRPVVPEGFDAPDSSEALLATVPTDTAVLVLRNFIHLEFWDTTSGPRVQQVLATYSAQVVGGYPLAGAYIVQIPDPGSYQALDSLLRAVRAESGVRTAFTFIFHEPARELMRLPIDGSSSQRLDWVTGSGTDATRGLRAIRAHLAWGCETGAYGGDPLPIGIVEHTVLGTGDLAGMIAQQPYAVPASEQLDTDTLQSGSKSHGTSVAGMITAKGDNNADIAGVMWRSELHVFELAVQTASGMRAVADRRAYFLYNVLPRATSAPIRILRSSSEFSADSALADRIAQAIQGFVNASTGGRLFVQAGGNTRGDFTPAQVASLGAGTMMMHVAVRLAANPATRNRFIYVGGANRTGTGVWTESPSIQGASLISGVTDLLAPAEDILALVRPQDYPGNPTTRLNGAGDNGGTSIAAPQVTGVAGLLWSFYPDLTADEVRTYILNGAKERIDPSGNIVSVNPIYTQGGMTLHLLNAYQSLARVAREKDDSPICGFPVYVGLDSSNNFRLYFERVPGVATRVPLSVTEQMWPPVSVAQGGRLLAVTFGDEADSVQYVDHRGVNVAGPFGAGRHVFLERDTVIVSAGPVGGGPAETRLVTLRPRSGGGSPITIDPETLVFGPETDSSLTFNDLIEFSPAGDWIAASVTRQSLTGLPTETRWVLIPWTAAPVPVTVKSYSYVASSCTPNRWELPRAGGGTWSHDGRYVIISAARSDNCLPQRTGAVLTQIVNGTPAVGNDMAFAGVEWFWPNFTADDSVLTVSEGDIGVGTCTKAKRELANLANRIAQSPALVDDCNHIFEGPQIFNSRIAGATAGRRPGRWGLPGKRLPD